MARQKKEWEAKPVSLVLCDSTRSIPLGVVSVITRGEVSDSLRFNCAAIRAIRHYKNLFAGLAITCDWRIESDLGGLSLDRIRICGRQIEVDYQPVAFDNKRIRAQIVGANHAN